MKIGIVKWNRFDGIAEAFEFELNRMRHHPITFLHTESIPDKIDILLTFAPYGRFYPIAKKIEKIPKRLRPVFIHWSCENVPDPRIPKPITLIASRLRTLTDRTQDSSNVLIQKISETYPLKLVNNRFHRFLHIADYRDAYQEGCLDILADISDLYTKYYQKYGIPAVYVPWGASTLWYKDLKLPRDIGVLWMGKRRTSYRSQTIDWIESEMQKRGIQFFIADDVKNPFIFGEKRIEMLNRSAITLNLQYIPYIATLPVRFGMVAGNKSMIIAEEMPPHSPELVSGSHYISGKRNELVKKILFFLDHEEERTEIAERAYQFYTSQLTMQNSLRILIDKALQCR